MGANVNPINNHLIIIPQIFQPNLNHHEGKTLNNHTNRHKNKYLGLFGALKEKPFFNWYFPQWWCQASHIPTLGTLIRNLASKDCMHNMIHHRPTSTIVQDYLIWPSTLGTNNAWLHMWFFHVWSSLPSNNNTLEVKPSTHIKWHIPQSHFRCDLPIRVFQYYFVWCVNRNRCQYGIAQQLLHPSSTISFWNTLNWSRLLIFRHFGLIRINKCLTP